MTQSDDIILDPGFADRFAREKRPPCQLYLISPPTIVDGFGDTLTQALAEGDVAAFQFRVKDLDDDHAMKIATPLQMICAKHDVAFIINDSMTLAKTLGADGVHLGQSDGSAKDARVLLGPTAQIGVTCHDNRHLAMEAGEAGADYVAFGAFFPSDTKTATHRAEASILGWWTTLFDLPCVAIGGITPANAAPIIAAGADFVAVSGAVWNDPDGAAAAVRKFNALF